VVRNGFVISERRREEISGEDSARPYSIDQAQGSLVSRPRGPLRCLPVLGKQYPEI